ncbi:MAG: hypothetical protein HQL50_00520 [Magnetococcales bacterium]|nr:hypothetical protein [Magnetococcales bacterium]
MGRHASEQSIALVQSLDAICLQGEDVETSDWLQKHFLRSGRKSPLSPAVESLRTFHHRTRDSGIQWHEVETWLDGRVVALLCQERADERRNSSLSLVVRWAGDEQQKVVEVLSVDGEVSIPLLAEFSRAVRTLVMTDGGHRLLSEIRNITQESPTAQKEETEGEPIHYSSPPDVAPMRVRVVSTDQPSREVSGSENGPDVDGVSEKLKMCREYLDADRLLVASDPKKTAFHCYRSVLRIDPDNPIAQEGMDLIEQRYFIYIKKALLGRDYDMFHTFYLRLRKINRRSLQFKAVNELYCTSFTIEEQQDHKWTVLMKPSPLCIAKGVQDGTS